MSIIGQPVGPAQIRFVSVESRLKNGFASEVNIVVDIRPVGTPISASLARHGCKL